MKPDICILTPEAGYYNDWQPSAECYQHLLGKRVALRTWTEAGDLSRFKLILPLLAWGYHKAVPRWYGLLDAWEAAGLPFANDIATLRWNTDKDYLLDLEGRGIAIVPTIECHGLTKDDLVDARARFGSDDLVVKPSISGGSDGTYRLGPNDPIPFDVLEREMLIQPVMQAILEEGEFSLFCFDGVLSHAVLKSPKAGDFRVQVQFGGGERLVEAPAPARALADATLAALPTVPLYARVDMVRDNEGAFRLMELEVIEPALFLHLAPDGGEAFVKAVLGRL